MDFEGLANLSWREALIAIAALLALYVLSVFFRLRRLKREKTASIETVARPEHPAVAAYAAVQEPELSAPSEPSVEPEEPAFAWNEPPPEIPGQPMTEALEREIAQLRKEVGSLRAEVLLLREQQRELSSSQVRQNVSPLYSDAMQMAMQGHEAARISQECGISRAEAELVAALARNQDTNNLD